jgi:TRAP-type C4-dicarboxylate transport system permease small subunit
LGIVAISVVWAVTCLDVIGVKTLRMPVPGALDLVVFSQAIAISFGAPMTLLAGRHVQVDFFIIILPARVRAVVHGFSLILQIILFALLTVQLVQLGRAFLRAGEMSGEALAPVYPFAFALAFACAVVCLALLSLLAKSLRGGSPR